ncbi:MBL fold metallo-hydrolase [Stenotrophomonas rhizophila]|uniref:MBL fold metallo-hydrolase n=1 Tax=Stenotrophomonas rhizophila TaxID=216778 RepID=UPI001E566A86|nr:MBL fold metallo-hydrolase [Stenotrophomonas rhizophila]MCC7633205.1 MBL fold metallo-hydrolase [Stenotrophomonas rhizophila]MCC7662098.1 MBL fold metallo-hydrolase [Stenotrophomonas rhizophila]
MIPLQWELLEVGHCSHPERAVRRGGRLSPCQFPALVGLLHHPRHGPILFDTGYAEAFFAATARFPERLYRLLTPVHLPEGASLRQQLRQRGLQPSDIALIFLSHLHGDHVGGVVDFPDTRLLCSRAGWDDQAGRSRLGALRMGMLPALTRAAQARMCWIEELPAVALPAGMEALGSGGDVLGDGSLLAVALPGHAIGQYGLLFHGSDGRPVFLLADAVWSSRAIRDGVPPPSLVTSLLGNTRVYRQTLAHLRDIHARLPDLQLVPSHCREWRPGGHGEQ